MYIGLIFKNFFDVNIFNGVLYFQQGFNQLFIVFPVSIKCDVNNSMPVVCCELKIFRIIWWTCD